MADKIDQNVQDPKVNLSRRQVLKTSAALAATAAVSACGGGGGL